LRLLGNLLDRWDDISIGSAAAEVAAHALTNLIVTERDMLSVQIYAHRTRPAGLDLAQHTDGRADLPRCTVAALEGVVFDKRSLQWVQILIIGESLDRDDLGTLMRDGESEATVYPPAIKQNGTGTALPMVAAFLGTGESEMLAQRIQERRSGINEKLVRRPVYLEGDLHVHSPCASFVLIFPCYKYKTWSGLQVKGLFRDTALRMGLTVANVKAMQFRAHKRAADLAHVVFD
jgi:hypothetical protein